MDNNKKNNTKLNKKTKIIIATAVLGIGLGGFLAYTVGINNNVKKWEDKIYPGVTVNGVDISGKTKDEAKDILQKSFVNAISDKKIVVKAANENLEINYKELKPEYNIDEVLENTFKYGKNGNIYTENSLIEKATKKNFELEFKYDEGKIKDYEKQLSLKVNQAAKNATISVRDGNISVVDSKTGRKINEEQMDKLIKESINGKIGETIELEVPVEEVAPKVTGAMLSKVNGKISSFSTSFAANSHPDSRDINLQIATNFVNGTLVLPGDEFSYNNTVGERTEARGFKAGKIFVGDKVEDGIGGGICQVSTTLYRAIMNAGIKSTERLNHSMQTSYSPLGLDATVSWGYLDYKFKNTYDFPIYIEAYISNKNVVFNIYGNVEGMGGKTYELVTDGLQTIEANINKVDDPTLAVGTEEWEKKPIPGYKVSSYLITNQNGNQINKEKIATDTYQKVDGILRIGTKK